MCGAKTKQVRIWNLDDLLPLLNHRYTQPKIEALADLYRKTGHIDPVFLVGKELFNSDLKILAYQKIGQKSIPVIHLTGADLEGDALRELSDLIFLSEHSNQL